MIPAIRTEAPHSSVYRGRLSSSPNSWLGGSPGGRRIMLNSIRTNMQSTKEDMNGNPAQMPVKSMLLWNKAATMGPAKIEPIASISANVV